MSDKHYGKKITRKQIDDDFLDCSLDSDSENENNNWNYVTKKKINKHKSFNDKSSNDKSSNDKSLNVYPSVSFSNFNNQKKSKFVLKEKDIKNKKKLLCNNIINTDSCCYGSKCMYAHTLSEQQIDTTRKKAYDILFGNHDLSNINFQNDISLYRSLRDLTKLCNEEYCTGGYNCKHGICGKDNKKYLVCLQDLEYGDCLNKNCEFVHLTKRFLKPFYSGYATKQPITNNNITDNNITDNNITDNNINNTLSSKSINSTKLPNLSKLNHRSNDDKLNDDKLNDDKLNNDKLNNDIEFDNIFSDESDTSYSSYSDDEYDQSIFEKSTHSNKIIFDQSHIENLFL